MAYENAKAQVERPQSAMDSMLGQANSLQTMAADLLSRLEKMDTRVNGNRPTAIGAEKGKAPASSQGIRNDLNETLNSIHQLLADCHSRMESLEGFV